MTNYQNRIVGFIDVLGFGDLVKATEGTDPTVSIGQIIDIMDFREPVGEGMIVLGDFGDISECNHNMSAFSDCIVMSVDPTCNGLLHLLHHIALIGFKLFRLKMLCRGGITVGLHHHDDNYTFGPAMIKSYEIEKQEKYPRVILHEDVIKISEQFENQTLRFYNELTRTDEPSGLVYVNILRVLRRIMGCESDPPDDIVSLCNDVRIHIRNTLENDNTKESTKDKWRWFESYFEKAADRSWVEVMKAPYPRKRS